MLARLLLLMLLLMPTQLIPKLIPSWGALPSIIVGYLWLTGVVVGFLWARVIPTSPLWGPFSARFLWKGLPSGLALFVVGIVGYVVSQKLGLTMSEEAQGFFQANSFGERGLVALVMLLAAVTEEVAFRGLLLSGLRDLLPTPVAILLGAVLFAVYHVSFFQAASTTLYGVGLAMLVVRAKSLWPAFIAHLTLNGLGLLLFAMRLARPS